MAGGLFEGLKKCFCGNNIAKKHIILAVFCFLASLPQAIAYSKLGLDAKDTEVYLYLLKHPILLLLTTVAWLVLTLYLINFTHNALKFFIWKESVDDPEKIKAIQIMPEFNGQIFSYFWRYLGFSCIWIVNFIVVFILFAVLMMIPFVNIITSFIIIFIMMISSPYIIVGFARNYQIQGNISPLLLLQYTKGTILATLWLYIRQLGLGLLYSIGVVIICAIVGVVAYALGFGEAVLSNVVVLSILITIVGYAGMLIYFAFNYAAAHIYYEKIEMNREI